MALSQDLKRLTGRNMQPDLLVAWVMKNRARLIEALEMDECTGGGLVAIPEVSLADLPAFVAQREARSHGD